MTTNELQQPKGNGVPGDIDIKGIKALRHLWGHLKPPIRIVIATVEDASQKHNESVGGPLVGIGEWHATCLLPNILSLFYQPQQISIHIADHEVPVDDASIILVGGPETKTF